MFKRLLNLFGLPMEMVKYNVNICGENVYLAKNGYYYYAESENSLFTRRKIIFSKDDVRFFPGREYVAMKEYVDWLYPESEHSIFLRSNNDTEI